MADRLIEQTLEAKHRYELVARSRILRAIYSINVTEQIEAVDDGQVPPELRALAEHDADARDVPNTIFVWNEAIDDDAASVRTKDSRENLDRRGLPCPIGTDEAKQLAALERECHVGQRIDAPASTVDETLHRAEQPGRSFRHEVRFGELLDDDLWQAVSYLGGPFSTARSK